jgi:glycosyltransferase involved in cell wall biosynthesis
MKELIKPGINGYLVNNVAEAVEAIGRCRQLDRRRVRAEAEQYHYLTMAKQYVELYHKIGAV